MRGIDESARSSRQRPALLRFGRPWLGVIAATSNTFIHRHMACSHGSNKLDSSVAVASKHEGHREIGEQICPKDRGISRGVSLC